MRVLLLSLLLLLPWSALSQSWRRNEALAGAALNVGLRGPYVAPSWRKPLPRAALAMAFSVAYERFVDAYGWSWPDVRGRCWGYLGTELGIAVIRRILQHRRL